MPVVKDWYSKTKLKYPQIKKAVLPLKARQLFSYSITSCLTTGTDNACVITNTYWGRKVNCVMTQTQDDLKLVDPGGFKLCNGDAVNGQS